MGDQEGNILAILVQRRRDTPAAKSFCRKRLKGCQYVPRVMVTDKLGSSGAAKREMRSSIDHRQHRYLNNRAENSHQLTRQRERRMQGFKSPGHAQRFLAAYGPIVQHFRPQRHRFTAQAYRQEMIQRFQSWREITGCCCVSGDCDGNPPPFGQMSASASSKLTRPADVLLASGEKRKPQTQNLTVEQSSRWSLEDTVLIWTYWNLHKDDLTLQDDPTIDWLYELLK